MLRAAGRSRTEALLLRARRRALTPAAPLVDPQTGQTTARALWAMGARAGALELPLGGLLFFPHAARSGLRPWRPHALRAPCLLRARAGEARATAAPKASGQIKQAGRCFYAATLGRLRARVDDMAAALLLLLFRRAGRNRRRGRAAFALWPGGTSDAPSRPLLPRLLGRRRRLNRFWKKMGAARRPGRGHVWGVFVFPPPRAQEAAADG